MWLREGVAGLCGVKEGPWWSFCSWECSWNVPTVALAGNAVSRGERHAHFHVLKARTAALGYFSNTFCLKISRGVVLTFPPGLGCYHNFCGWIFFFFKQNIFYYYFLILLSFLNYSQWEGSTPGWDSFPELLLQ